MVCSTGRRAGVSWASRQVRICCARRRAVWSTRARWRGPSRRSCHGFATFRPVLGIGGGRPEPPVLRTVTRSCCARAISRPGGTRPGPFTGTLSASVSRAPSNRLVSGGRARGARTLDAGTRWGAHGRNALGSTWRPCARRALLAGAGRSRAWSPEPDAGVGRRRDVLNPVAAVLLSRSSTRRTTSCGRAGRRVVSFDPLSTRSFPAAAAAAAVAAASGCHSARACRPTGAAGEVRVGFARCGRRPGRVRRVVFTCRRLEWAADVRRRPGAGGADGRAADAG